MLDAVLALVMLDIDFFIKTPSAYSDLRITLGWLCSQSRGFGVKEW